MSSVHDQLPGAIRHVGDGRGIHDGRLRGGSGALLGNRVAPIPGPNGRAYLERLLARPSFARVLAEAEPYEQLFPGD